MGPSFEQPPDGHLEATWEVSWLSWGPLGRQDLQVQVQAHLTALSVLTSIFVRQMQVPFLDHFWNRFGAQFGVPLGSLFKSKSESKMGPFFEQPPDGHLEATWEVSWLSWGSLGSPGVPDSL